MNTEQIAKASLFMLKWSWRDAWRTARIIKNSKPENPSAFTAFKGLLYLAIMRLNDRERSDPLSYSPETNLMVNKMADEIAKKNS